MDARADGQPERSSGFNPNGLLDPALQQPSLGVWTTVSWSLTAWTSHAPKTLNFELGRFNLFFPGA